MALCLPSGRPGSRREVPLSMFDRQSCAAVRRRERPHVDPATLTALAELLSWHVADAYLAEVARGQDRPRHTPAGNGSTRAAFSTEVPEAGSYRLAIHLPGAAVSEGRWRPRSPLERDSLGSLHLARSTGGPGQPVTFAGGDAVPGWDDVGGYDLPAGLVRGPPTAHPAKSSWPTPSAG